MDKLVISSEYWAFSALQPPWIVLVNTWTDNRSYMSCFAFCRISGLPFPLWMEGSRSFLKLLDLSPRSLVPLPTSHHFPSHHSSHHSTAYAIELHCMGDPMPERGNGTRKLFRWVLLHKGVVLSIDTPPQGNLEVSQSTPHLVTKYIDKLQDGCVCKTQIAQTALRCPTEVWGLPLKSVKWTIALLCVQIKIKF